MGNKSCCTIGDSSCKEEKVEDFILKPEKLMETKKLWAASPLSLSIFWAKKTIILLRPQTQGELLIFFAQKMLSLALHDRVCFVKGWSSNTGVYSTNGA